MKPWGETVITRDRILTALSTAGQMTVGDLSERLCREISTVRCAIVRLRKDRMVRIVGHRKAGGRGSSAYSSVFDLGDGTDVEPPRKSNLYRHER